MSDAELTLTQHIDAPPEDVFPFLIDAERYAAWQGTRAELDPRPGGIFKVWVDERWTASGSYVVVDPPTRVVFTWGWEGNELLPPGASTVEILLESDGGGTSLTLRHSGLPDEGAAASHEEGWRYFIPRLAVAVPGGDPGPIPPPPGEAPTTV